MVKIALQLSGKFRCTEECFSSLMGAIIEPLQPDIYCSFWEPTNIKNFEKYINVLKPTALELEDQSIIKPCIDSIFTNHIYKNLPSMSYKFYRVKQLRKSIEIKENKKYDVIIQARTDNLFFEKLDYDRCKLALDQNAILCANQEYYPPIDDFIPRPRIADNFYIGPAKLMDLANDTFWFLKNQSDLWFSQQKLYEISIPEIIQSKIWQDNKIPIGSLPGIGRVGNFWYEIDKRETEYQ